jgi:CHAD domain-containing protein
MNTQSPQPAEIEAKYACPDPKTFAQLISDSVSLPGYRLGERQSVSVTDVYLDTADYTLLRKGYQLRVRRQNGQSLVTLKTRGVGDAAGIFRRLEIEEPLAGEGWPAKLADCPEAIVSALGDAARLGTPLQPLCILDQTRITRLVTAQRTRKPDAGRPLAHLSLDEMRLRQVVDGPVLARAYEIEVELAAGVDEAELQVLANRFQAAFQLLPSAESKLERGLRILSRHPAQSPESWQGLEPKMHMGEACRLIWQEQLMALLLNEAGARFDTDPEPVHAMRVAIRRARAAARLYGSFFKRRAVRQFLKQLRHTARLLGAVRDLDVAIDKLERYRQKSKKRATRELRATVEQWVARRTAAHRALMAWLDDPRYAKFLAEFAQFCRTPGRGLADFTLAAGEEITPFQVRHVCPSMVINRFERVRSYEIWFEGEENPPVETLHRLRIECKYLRYNLEFIADLLGEESAALTNRLRSLQDCLGDLNDAVVSKGMVAADDQVDGGVARYQQAQDRIIAEKRKQLRASFVAFVGAENRRALLSAVASL